MVSDTYCLPHTRYDDKKMIYVTLLKNMHKSKTNPAFKLQNLQKFGTWLVEKYNEKN